MHMYVYIYIYTCVDIVDGGRGIFIVGIGLQSLNLTILESCSQYVAQLILLTTSCH